MWPAVLRSGGGVVGAGSLLGGGSAWRVRRRTAGRRRVVASGRRCLCRAVAGWPLGPPPSRLLDWCHHGVGARVTWCSLKHRGGASACAGFLSAGCFAEVAGACSCLDHERAAGVVESGVSRHRSVDMMAAPLGRRNPCWGHLGEPLCYRPVDSQGEDLVHLDVRRGRLGVVTFLEASHLGSRCLCDRRGCLEVMRGACLVRVAVRVRRVHGCCRS
jgi:hypothetical protein